MSVANTISLIATKMTAVAVSGQNSPTVYSDPKEAVAIGDFPAIVLALAPATQQVMKEFSPQNAVHDYTIAIYLFLGSYNLSNLPELHSRVLGWPQAIATVLFADLTLGGAVQFIGNTNSEGPLFTYEMGPIMWATDNYFGLKILLPVEEWFITPMA